MTFWEFACTFGGGMLCGAWTLLLWIGIMATMKAGKDADAVTKALLEQHPIDVTSDFRDLHGED